MKQAFLVIQKDSLAIDEPKAVNTRLSSSNRYYIWLIIGLTGLTFLVRLLTAPAFIETREGIFYVRGVVRYSVAELRPYWPGYPVYMWLGKVFAYYTGNPVFALHLLGILSTTLCLVPIAFFSYSLRQGAGGSAAECWLAAFGAMGVWIFAPISWLNGSEIFGDSLALLMSLGVLWLGWLSLENRVKAPLYLISAGVLYGFMLGVRLAYLPLIVVLVYATWQNRRIKINLPFRKSWPVLPGLVMAGMGLAVLCWLGWQVYMEGFRFFSIGSSQLAGHYEDWGNSFISDPNRLTRPFRLIITGIIYGLGGWWWGAPLIRIPATLFLVWLVINGARTLLKTAKRTDLTLVALWLGSYVIWTIFNYDVDLTRYNFPVIVVICLLAGLGLPKIRLLSYLALAGMALSMAIVTVPLALEHQNNPPIGVKLTNYIKTNLTPANSTVIITDDAASLIFYTTENTPNYYTIRYSYAEIPAVTKNLEAQGRQVYATLLPSMATGDWVPVARLCRGIYMDSRGPLEVWLYRYGPGPADLTVVGDCAAGR